MRRPLEYVNNNVNPMLSKKRWKVVGELTRFKRVQSSCKLNDI
jgi:hypothetical protein